MILFDTNLLVYVHNRASPNHKRAFELETQVLKGELVASISAQNLLEFYATVTNPAKMEKPLTGEEANKVISDYFQSSFKIIYPSQEALKLAFSLTKKKKLIGRRIFDIYLAATMIVNNVDTIYTNNEKHFRIFKELKVVNPFK